ncbi:protein-L-isoaspartate(D-aspartate) O-methyltransferase [Thalassoroseus pseudoceratinae]|uniref:protein-L-isoaspartate(D-aspartate) O-methyltransferase n=1 Tax=Thalassoroseus pseudoceratinae TaxID=2713176 RepID=UPI0014241701|nr:protein-L-isoaspartate(D-aspartate) O-methyltransferase [Thalassoroseus pseudoceratinae]
MPNDASSDQLIQSLTRKGIQDQRVLAAIAKIPRERFVLDEDAEEAYVDTALPIDCGQTISQPYIVALMTQAFELTGDETVLEIGTGSGYQTAILSQLCRHVVSIERHEALAQTAQSTLSDLQITNVSYRLGDGTLGCAELGPYDGILVAAAAPKVPQSLVNQLRNGGRIVIPVGEESSQSLILATRTPQQLRVEKLCDCRFVKLIGAEGWPASDG